MFVAIGVMSTIKSSGTKNDYYLASGHIKPWLAGMSAVATCNSGYMFVGVIGYTYVAGLSAIWMMIGWIAGDLMASFLVHRRLRAAVDRTGEISYAGVLSEWFGHKEPKLQRLIGVIILVFLSAYASAQLVAGSKALHVLLGWPTWAGAVVGAVLVSIYCFAGGIRASIWTDAAQSVVMVLSMALLFYVAVDDLGGLSLVVTKMQAIDGYLDWFPKELALPGVSGAILFVMGWMVAGISVVGQPHVMVRFMTLPDADSVKKSRYWYYAWYFAFYLLATGVGLLSRIFYGNIADFDAELALPMMANDLLPPYLVGLVLAGIFAATMSTADSVILSCSSAITHDILPKKVESTFLIKLATVGVTFFALLWALTGNQSVFSLVLMAWSGLGSAFAPLLIVLCFGKRPRQSVSMLAIIVGLGAAVGWRYMGWQGLLYEGFFGVIAGLLVFIVAEWFFKHRNPQ